MPLATPLGHSLCGLACARLLGTRSAAPRWRWYVFAVIAANAADFDFLPGLLVGNINEYHQGAAHSIGAAVVFGLLSPLFCRWLRQRPVPLAVAGALTYASHLLLDYFVDDRRPPFGIPVFWPVNGDHWISPFTVFSGVRHGVPGDSFAVFIGEVFSRHNVATLGMELLILGPVLAFSWYYTRSRWGRPPRMRQAAARRPASES